MCTEICISSILGQTHTTQSRWKQMHIALQVTWLQYEYVRGPLILHTPPLLSWSQTHLSYQVGYVPRESASALPFFLWLGRYTTQYSYSYRERLHWLSLVFFSSILSNHSSKQWSVSIAEGLPSRYTLKFGFPSLMAKLFFLTVKQLPSWGNKFRLK